MYMENSHSGIKRKILGDLHRLWCFLFGWIYYASKGAWGWAFVSFITLNGLLIIMPLYNRGIIQRCYENSGWRLVK